MVGPLSRRALAAAAALIALLATAPPATAAETVTVRGTFAVGSGPVDEGTVVAVGRDPGELDEAQLAADGSFELTLTSGSVWDLTFHASGELESPAGQFRVDYTLWNVKPGLEDFTLEPIVVGDPLVVSIEDPHGSPTSAEVTLACTESEDETSWRVQIDGSGTLWGIPDIFEGEGRGCWLTAKSPNGVVNGPTAVQLGEATDDEISLVVRDTVTVSGLVWSRVGDVTAGRVEATTDGGAGDAQDLVPGSSFALDLEPGTWNFEVAFSAGESYESHLMLYGVEVRDEMALNAVRPEDSLLVTVESSPGVPARADLELSCRSETADAPYEVHRTTDYAEADGSAVLWGIPDHADTHVCSLTATFEDGVEVARRVHLDPNADDTIVLRPPELAAITGTVTLPAGAVEGLRVQACDVIDHDSGDAICTGWAEVGADGTYALPVLPDTYDYVRLWGGSWDGVRLDLYEEDVAVTEDGAVLDWELETVDVTVHVVDEVGAPATGSVAVTCSAEPGSWFTRLSTLASVEVTGSTVLPLPVNTDVELWCSVYGSGGSVLDFTVVAPAERAFTMVVPDGVVLEGGPEDSVADTDGVPDLVEILGPNGGDGNGDGVADSEQTHVATLPQGGAGLGDGAAWLTVVGPASGRLSEVSTLDEGSLPPPPSGVSLPAGLASFVVEGITPGSTHTITLYAGSTDGVTGYAKYDDDGGWSLLPPARVQVHPDRVDITLTDGGTGDADGVADGRITDPGGPAVVEPSGDNTPPQVAGAFASPPNANGWHAGDVTVRWTATDESGIADLPPDTIVGGEGASLTAESEPVCDLAPVPNCATGTLEGIRIDRTPPTVAVSGRTDGASYVVGAVPAATCAASDALSGLAGACTVSTTGGTSRGVGTYVTTARAVDRAGNVRISRVTYRVVYGFDGFLPPLNDGPEAAMSVFRRGSTVTVAFALRRADGSVIAPATAPTWITPQRGARTRASVNEATYGGRTTSGSRFVLRNGRWEYTWSTRGVTSDYVYRLGARLDDGTIHTINIGVR